MYKIRRDEFNEEFKKAGGKILTTNDYIIPSEFEKNKFINKSTTYYSDNIKKYDDDLL
jgi:hypothetical protein